MSDFRERLYDRYVSEFKGDQSRRDERALASHWRWCEHRYLPLLAELPRDTPVLELGCGPGAMLEFLGRQGFTRVSGVDASPEQVELARARGLDARVADVFEALEADGSGHGAILAIDFVEHFSKDELNRLMPAIHRRLEPGGLLVLQTPNGAGLMPGHVIHGDLTHLTIFEPGSLRQLLLSWGFGEPRFFETGPVPVGWKGRLRTLAWKGIRLAANAVRLVETGTTQPIWTEVMICATRRRG